MTSKPEEFDIIISGAGLAGASMALALSKLTKADGKPLAIGLIEAFALQDNLPKSYDARVIALSHGSACYLKQLGVWQQLKTDAMAIETIHISDRGHYGKARMSAADHQVSALGYVSEMQVIGNAIVKQLLQCNHVKLFSEQTITKINWQADSVLVSTEHSNTQSFDSTQPSANSSQPITHLLKASLLLGCDGGQSICRQQANIQSQVTDYKQVAIIANVSPEKPHNNVAYERFTEFGPLAMLPMTDNRCSLVWTVAVDQVEQIMALSDQQFSQQLQNAFGSWLGCFTEVGKRFSFPLSLVQAHEQVNHRMVLIGNASHTLHPIAGQGFNLGMRDVQDFIEHIKVALHERRDIGDYQWLNQYALQRKKDHQQVITLTDSLVHLFSNSHLPLVAGRGIGLKALNYFTPLKSLLVKKTMGH